MPPFNNGWIIFFSLIPFFITLNTISAKPLLKTRLYHSLIHGFLFGFIFMGFSNLWMFELIHYSSTLEITCLYIVFTLMQSIFYCLFACFCCSLRLPLWLFPFSWVIAEWLRGSGLFASTHYALGYSQSLNGLFLQYASLGGLYLVSFLCVLINIGLIYWFKLARISLNQRKYFLSIAIFPGIFIILMLFNLFLAQKPPTSTATEPLKLGIFQPNHKQADKLNKQKRYSLIRDYVTTVEDTIFNDDYDLILFPETIVPRAIDNTIFKHALSHFTATSNTSFLFGSSRKNNQSIYNSVILYESDANITTYDKVHLMPFGEYWPYKNLFKTFGLNNIIPSTEYSKGQAIAPLQFNQYKLGIGICLELMYPSFFKTHVKNDADILINLANSAWFHDSWISKTLFEMAIFRAVENGRFVIQVSNIGISGIVSPEGKVVTTSELNKKAFIKHHFSPYKKDTLFVLFGHWIIFVSALVLAANIVIKKQLLPSKLIKKK